MALSGIARANARRESLKDVVMNGIMHQSDRREFIEHSIALHGMILFHEPWQL